MMNYQKHINSIIIFVIVLLVSCSGTKNMHSNSNIIGIWEGQIKIPKTYSAILVFGNNNEGSITYTETNQYKKFKFSISNDSIITLIRNNFKSCHHFKITGNKLKLTPIESNEESIEIINLFDYQKSLD